MCAISTTIGNNAKSDKQAFPLLETVVYTEDFTHGSGGRGALHHRNAKNIKLHLGHLVSRNPLATLICYSACLSLFSPSSTMTFYISG